MSNEPARSTLPGRILVLLLGGLLVATVCALLAPVGWPFELFAHFRVQYAVAAALVAAGLVAVGRPGFAVVAVALALYQALPLLQIARAGRTTAACTGPAFTVATVNLLYRNHDRQPVLDWLAAETPDLVIVQELTPEWAAELSRAAGYAHRRLLTRRDAYGIGILSRWPLDHIQAVDLADDGLPSLSGVVEIHGRPVVVLGLHARWPITPRLLEARDDALRRAAHLIRSEPLPTVVIGDFNLTPFSPAFARFRADSGLRDALAGAGWSPTWQAGFWPLALRIDHVLVPPSVCVNHAAVGPAIGSDHRPVVVGLVLGKGTR